MLQHLRPALVLIVLFSVLTGLVYPLAVTGIAQIALPYQANGSLIQKDGVVVGFAVCTVHPSSWTLHPSCYLEDLFVRPDVRGTGAGRALLEDLVAMAKARPWSRLYWHTATDNAYARRLYDHFAKAGDFVRYRVSFP